MRAVCGFGNPGKQYEKTRHNIGFLAIDALAGKHNVKVDKYNFGSLWAKVHIHEEDVLLVKPLTYMNLVGSAVKDIFDRYKLTLQDVLVIHDDADLELGRIKISKTGGDAGHRGVRSTIESLGSKDFPRIKLGVGRPADRTQLREYVLEQFTPREWELVKEVLSRCVAAVHMIMGEGIEKTMSMFNQYK